MPNRFSDWTKMKSAAPDNTGAVIFCLSASTAIPVRSAIRANRAVCLGWHWEITPSPSPIWTIASHMHSTGNPDTGAHFGAFSVDLPFRENFGSQASHDIELHDQWAVIRRFRPVPAGSRIALDPLAFGKRRTVWLPVPDNLGNRFPVLPGKRR